MHIIISLHKNITEISYYKVNKIKTRKIKNDKLVNNQNSNQWKIIRLNLPVFMMEGR